MCIASRVFVVDGVGVGGLTGGSVALAGLSCSGTTRKEDVVFDDDDAAVAGRALE